MFETYSLGQITKLTKLLEYTDKMMEKEDYRKLIFENEFFESLN